MKAVAIIVCYNGQEYIEKCLNTLFQDKSLHKVILVDNNSDDNSLEIVRTKYKDVVIKSLDQNIGFGRANNIGIEIGLEEQCEYFFLLNQDTYCQQGCISKLIEVHLKNSGYGIIAPIQLNGKGDKIDTKFYKYLFNQNKSIGNDLYAQNPGDIYPVDFVNAAAWLISKECILKVGGFDPIFFHTGEDDDYVKRLKYWGFNIGISLNSFVCHDRPQISWSDTDASLAREVTLGILSLKDSSASISKNLLHWLLKKSYYIFYDILNLRFRSAKVKAISTLHVVRAISSIKDSRNKSMKEFTFLRHNNSSD
jgi:GT2 family glycosyltransferase